MLNSSFHFSRCRAGQGGGGLYADLKTRGWTPKERSVGLHLAVRSVLSEGSNFTFLQCAAGESGGGLWSENLTLRQSGLRFISCLANQSGGGLELEGHANVERSLLRFVGCQGGVHDIPGANFSHLRGLGGCAHILHGGNFSQSKLKFQRCVAGRHGGGLSASSGSVLFNNTEASFKLCRASRSGGGMSVYRGEMHVLRGLLRFQNCSSSNWGGGFWVKRKAKLADLTAHFEGCHAGRSGGGFEAGSLKAKGSLLAFSSCTASGRASAFVTTTGARTTNVNIKGCLDSSLTPIAVIGNFTAEKVRLDDAGMLQDRKVTVTAQHLAIDVLDCAAVSQCSTTGDSVQVPKLRCPPGRGKEGAQGFVQGCEICEGGTLQPMYGFNPVCVACPSEFEICNGTHLKMREGYMVDVPHLSELSKTMDMDGLFRLKKSFHCPNSLACPGGWVSLNRQTPMCAEGYTGEGCTLFEPGWAASDTTAFAFVRCATSTFTWSMQVAYFVAKDVVLFTLSVSGVFGAKAGRKRSTVLLNQMMSFATLCASCLEAIMQTSAFGDLQDRLQEMIRSWGLIVNLAQGQSAGSISAACLGDFVGLPKTLWMAHILRSATPLLLMLILAGVFDPWLALVAGTNCFLPSFCAGFGRYLVFMRLNADEDLRFHDLPGSHAAVPYVVISSIVLCFAATIHSWRRAAQSTKMPPPLHVVYISCAYKPEFAAWEVERLVRKMLLTLFRAMFPVTLVPILQLAGMGILLAASLCAYLYLMPYKDAEFNHIEASLLLAGVILSTLSSCVVAQDKNIWGQNKNIEYTLLLVVAVLASAGATGMILVVGRAMLEERRAEANSDARAE